jgi:NAD-dependent deacetylase
MNSDVFFSIGTSAEVYPAAMLPMIAKQSGAYVVEINIEGTPNSYLVDETLVGRASEIVPLLKKII